MRRDLMRMAILVLLALALAAPLGAQGSVTGSVRGIVTDPDGAGLPGVTVTATSDRLITGQLVAVTDESGNYRFPSRCPGRRAGLPERAPGRQGLSFASRLVAYLLLRRRAFRAGHRPSRSLSRSG